MKIVYTREEIEAQGFVFIGKSFSEMVGRGRFQRTAYELDVTQDSLRSFRTKINEENDTETWELFFTPNKQQGYVLEQMINF